MRNDYIGYGILKDMSKYRQRCIKLSIKDTMSIEQIVIIKSEILKLNYKELVTRLKELESSER